MQGLQQVQHPLYAPKIDENDTTFGYGVMYSPFMCHFMTVYVYKV